MNIICKQLIIRYHDLKLVLLLIWLRYLEVLLLSHSRISISIPTESCIKLGYWPF